MNYSLIITIVLSLILVKCNAFTGRGKIYPGRNDLYELSVIHLNDFHARFEEISPRAGPCQPDAVEECIGGIARVYTATNQLIEERPNAIFLNAGDHYQGTLWYTVHRWNITTEFMNKLPHDVMTIGNHEFDHGIEGLVPFLKMVNAPVVVTNIDATDEPTFQGLTRNSTVIERSGRKIGVIGVILSTTNEISNTEKLKFLDEVETVNLEAEKLKREENVDIVIVLSHCGLDVDKTIAAKCPTVDLIVGGHSHSFLYSGIPPYIDSPVDNYPVVIIQPATNRTVLIVQAAAFTKYLGNLTVWFDERGEIVDWEGNPILLDHSIEQDPQIMEDLKPWKVEVDAIGNRIIGFTKVILQNDCRRRECNIGNFITDAMIDAWMNKVENETYWTYAAIACMHAGGFRSSIGGQVDTEITYNHLLTALPFENTWDVAELKGRDIIQTLEISVATSYDHSNFAGRSFLTWSGLKATFDLSKEPYNRLVDVKVRCRGCKVPIYEEINPDDWYRIVLPSYLIQGGDGHHVIEKNHRNHEVGIRDIDHLFDYIRRTSPILQDFRWVPRSLGQSLPTTAIVGGHDVDGSTIYVGRASHEGDMIPAKVIPDKNAAYISYGGKEHSKDEYEVLVEGEFTWEFFSNDVIPPDAVIAGETFEGEPLYVGRVLHNGAQTVGKVQTSHGCLYIPFGGEELSFTDYEVLVNH